MNANFKQIPIIDLSNFDENKHELAKELVNICETVGFFYVKGHGIAPQQCTDMMQLAKKFFAYPMAEKQKIALSEENYMRGYTANKGTATEKNECIRLGMDLPLDHPHVLAKKPLHGPNPNPDFLPEFKPLVNNYLDELNKLAKKLLILFALGLGLEEDFFFRHADTPLSTLLLLKYPVSKAVNIEGCRPHTDFHCLTILMQDQVGGLQVQNLNGDWIDATPIENSFVVNIGDLLSYWTRGRFVATPDRVLRISEQERYSIPYFFNVNYDTMIDPQQIDVLKEGDEFPPKIAGEHVVSRTNAVYIKHQG